MIKKILHLSLILLLSTSLIHAKSDRKGKGEHHFGKKGRKIEMPKFDKKAMLVEDSINGLNKVGGLRFAKQFEVILNLENSGEVTVFDDNSKIWQVDILSDSALSINLIFSKFHLVDGDSLYIYNENITRVLGPLTMSNNLQSGILPLAPIAGSHLIVEFHQSSVVSAFRALEIGSVNHDYRGFKLLPKGNDYWKLDYSGDSCSLPVSCVPEIVQVKKSVCLLVINGSSYCSGTLINNTAQDGKPYVLTAAHCFDTTSDGVDFAEGQTVAPTMVAFFNYEMPNCDENIRGSQEFAIGGATMKALAGDLDFALVELSSTPPVDFRPYMAGWNLAAAPTAPFRGIHHPYGKVKVTTLENNNLTTTSFSGMLSNSHWKVATYEVGTTQPGSSGSGIFDASLKLVGALTGGSSECISPNNDYFYKLNKSWDYYSTATAQLKAWLDPTSSGATSLNGMNPYGNDSALRYSNFALIDSAKAARLDTPESGYVGGQNSLGISEYAERFCLDENAYLYGLYIMPCKANANASGTSLNVINIKVYAGINAPNPSYFLDDQDIDIQNLQWSTSFSFSNKAVLSANENYVQLDAPIAVGDTFFITYEIPYTNLPTDTFAVYSAKPRATGQLESAYAYYGGSWVKMFDVTGTRTSFWIDPVIRYNPSALAIDTSLVERSSKTVVFPNPARDIVNIMTRSDKEGECEVTLYSTYGQKISSHTGKVRYTNIPIDVSNLPKGLYLLRVAYSDLTETHKLIVD